MKKKRFLNASLIALLALIAFALPVQRGSVVGSALAEAGTSSVTDSLPLMDLARHSDLRQISALGEKSGVSESASLARIAGERREIDASAVMFIENVGQFADGARFQVRGADKTIWLAEDGLWVTVVEKPSSPQPPSANLGEGGDAFPSPRFGRAVEGESQPSQGVNIRLSFAGANPHLHLEPFNRLETHVSYFIGSDPAKWHADVPVWGGVRYKDLYPGIDLEITSENGHLVQRLVTQPGADLSAVRLRIEGADAVELLTSAPGSEGAFPSTLGRGAGGEGLLPSPSGRGAGGEDLLPSPSGRGAGGEGLLLHTAIGDFTLPLLTTEAFPPERAQIQRLNEQAFDIKAPFALTPSLPLSLFPQDNPSDLLYATFIGASDSEWGSGIAIDASGEAYITGSTSTSNFPTTPGAFDPSYNGGWDAYVVKLNASGSALAYATFLGGSGGDSGRDITLDSSGAAYVTGSTYSSDFPTTPGALDPTCGTDGNCNFSGIYTYRDAFVVKLNGTGTALTYATFLGGSNDDWINGIGVDSSGAAYVTGYTASSDFPTTTGAFDPTCGTDGNCNFNGAYSNSDAFVVKLNGTGTALIYATFLGGSDDDWISGIALNSSGATYVTGYTESSDFPTTSGAFDISYNGGLYDAFVVELNAGGSTLIYATLLGGIGNEEGSDIAIDSHGAAYVTGLTSSSDFPTTIGAFDPSYNGSWDAFVVKLNPSGSALNYGTFLGGNNDDAGYGIALDSSGAVYITGYTISSGFPTTPGAFDTSYNGFDDAFVVKLNANGSALTYATFLGASFVDRGFDIALDSSGAAVVTGYTKSSDFPTTTGAFDPTCGTDGNCNDNGTYNYEDAFVVKLIAGPFTLYLPLVLR